MSELALDSLQCWRDVALKSGLDTDMGIGMQAKSVDCMAEALLHLLSEDRCEGRAQKNADEVAWANGGDGASEEVS